MRFRTASILAVAACLGPLAELNFGGKAYWDERQKRYVDPETEQLNDGVRISGRYVAPLVAGILAAAIGAVQSRRRKSAQEDATTPRKS